MREQGLWAYGSQRPRSARRSGCVIPSTMIHWSYAEIPRPRCQTGAYHPSGLRRGTGAHCSYGCRSIGHPRPNRANPEQLRHQAPQVPISDRHRRQTPSQGRRRGPGNLCRHRRSRAGPSIYLESPGRWLTRLTVWLDHFGPPGIRRIRRALRTKVTAELKDSGTIRCGIVTPPPPGAPRQREPRCPFLLRHPRCGGFSSARGRRRAHQLPCRSQGIRAWRRCPRTRSP